MSDVIARILTVDQFSVLIVATLTVGAGYFVSQALSAMMAILFVPGFLVGALVSIYLFREFGILIGPDNDTNATIASGVGIIVSLLIMLALVRFTMSLRKVRHPVTK